MAKRRMLSKEVLTDDWFVDMPMGAKLLYVYLNLEADDDGFITSVNMAIAQSGASKDDLRILIAKNYVIEIREGLKLIKHWKVNNYIQKDRYNQSRFHDELKGFYLKDDGSYTTEITEKPALDTKCIQNGYTGKDSIGKVSLVKDSLEKERIDHPEEKEREESSISIPMNWDKPIDPYDETKLNKQGFKMININGTKKIVPMSYEFHEDNETDWCKELEDVD